MRATTTARLGASIAAAVAAATLLAGCGSSDASSAADGRASSTTAEVTTSTSIEKTVSKDGPSTDVVKDVLAVTKDPPGAPGRTLTLIRYTIPPGAKLAPHIHPGVQLAAIVSGDLSYTVVSGTAKVRRAGASTDEAITGPQTITLGPGDAVTEVDGMVHFGANATKAPIVIEATLLTKDGEDLAVPVSTTLPASTTTGG